MKKKQTADGLHGLLGLAAAIEKLAKEAGDTLPALTIVNLPDGYLLLVTPR